MQLPVPAWLRSPLFTPPYRKLPQLLKIPGPQKLLFGTFPPWASPFLPACGTLGIDSGASRDAAARRSAGGAQVDPWHLQRFPRFLSLVPQLNLSCHDVIITLDSLDLHRNSLTGTQALQGQQRYQTSAPARCPSLLMPSLLLLFAAVPPVPVTSPPTPSHREPREEQVPAIRCSEAYVLAGSRSFSHPGEDRVKTTAAPGTCGRLFVAFTDVVCWRVARCTYVSML